MTDYTADDGLKVLEYFGITNITDAEREVFKDKWENCIVVRRIYMGTAGNRL